MSVAEAAGSSQSPVVAVVGPTATGKSDLGLDLAERLGGEIVNADAMQLYRGMDIGTAKLPAGAAARHRPPPARRPRRGARRRRSRRTSATPARTCGTSPRAGAGRPGRRLRPLRPAVLDRPRFPADRPGGARAARGRGHEPGGGCLAPPAGRAGPGRRRQHPPANVRRVVRALEVMELTGQPFTASSLRAGSSLPQCCSACASTEPRSMTASTAASSGCGPRACSRRRRPCSTAGSASAPRRPGPSATARPSPSPMARSTKRTRVRTPPGRPVATPVARSRGSAPTRASCGSTRSRQDLLDRALAVVHETEWEPTARHTGE